MPSVRFTPFSIFLLLAVFNVREIGGAKCTFSFVQGAAVCNNVNSFREVAVEMRSTWISVKINNRLGGSFAMVLTESENNDNLRYVETLDLGNIGHVSISNAGFKPFLRLMRLNLSDASLRAVDSGWFDENNSITQIDLSHNEIARVQRSDMQSLRKLVEINFADNNIESIEANAFNDASRLVKLNFQFNRIRAISSMGELFYLKELNLSENSITEIPYGLFTGLRTLANMTFAQNNIQTIAEGAFAGLDSLEILNISGNSIRQLTPNVFTTVQLKVLDLSRNDMAVIGDSTFVYLRYLEELDLQRNSLQFLGENTFSGLIGLKSLYLTNNDISVIAPNTFAGMRTLIRLDLSFNSLTQISGAMFGPNRLSLRKLFIRNNYLEDIPGDTFQSVPNLDFISLGHNRITTLDDNLFVPLKSLRKLHIQSNAITELSSAVMNEVVKLVELHIKSNRLTFLPETNATFSNLEKVSLEGNPWQCPCLFEIFHFITRRRVDYGSVGNPFYMGLKPICYATPVSFCVRDTTLVQREGVVSKYEAAVNYSKDHDN